MIKKSSGCQMANYLELDSTDTDAFDVVCPDTTIDEKIIRNIEEHAKVTFQDPRNIPHFFQVCTPTL